MHFAILSLYLTLFYYFKTTQLSHQHIMFEICVILILFKLYLQKIAICGSQRTSIAHNIFEVL